MLLLKLIFNTVKTDFPTTEADSYHLGKFFFFYGNEPITLTFFREIKKQSVME